MYLQASLVLFKFVSLVLCSLFHGEERRKRRAKGKTSTNGLYKCLGGRERRQTVKTKEGKREERKEEMTENKA